MRVLTVLGSPRKEGNTAAILGWAEQELRLMNHQVTRVDLSELNFTGGCFECRRCQDFQNDLGCVADDDALKILKLMTQTDLILFASPIIFWNVSTVMKGFWDRMYCLATGFLTPDHQSLLQGRSMALLLTGGGGTKGNPEPVMEIFDRLCRYAMAENAGVLMIPYCTEPEELEEDAREQVREFAYHLAETEEKDELTMAESSL